MKKIFNALLNVLIILLIIGIGYLFFQSFDSLKNLTIDRIYYPIINPKAGAFAYEREYKNNSDKAEKLKLKTNALVSKMQEESLKPTDRKITDINEEFNLQLTDIFNERDQLLKELIEIDNKSLNLSLPEEYNVFYIKRLKADLNEYDAFKDYRMGIDTLFKGMVLYEFDEKYTPVMDYLVDVNNLTKDSVYQIELSQSQFESFYASKITPLISSNFFTKDLSASLENKMNTMRVISNFQIARLSGDDNRAQKYYHDIEALGQKEDPKSPVEMFLDWSKEKVQPFFYTQDEKHKKSYSLFNDAYKHAKNKKLKEILGIWDGDYPGSAEYVPEKPTYKL